MRVNFLRQLILAAASTLLLLLSAPAQAIVPGLFRAYLSVNGDDVNPCTLQQPCRLLPAALAAVKDGGEIWMLDSANFNTAPVAITKSVMILAVPGALGSVVGNGGNAIVINTASVVVTLRNLQILNLSTTANGIAMTNGAKLRVENCVVYGFTGSSNAAGIYVGTPAQVSITDTVVRDNFFGIWLDNGATVTISRTHVVGNSSYGIIAAPSVTSTVTAFINDSVVNSNGAGVYASGGTGKLARAYVTGTVASGNSQAGFFAGSTGAVGDGFMELSNSVASGNGNYGLFNSTATFQSGASNRVSGNTPGDTNGPITPTASK